MSRDEAMAASYHADTMDAERKAMYDVATQLAAALEGQWEGTGRCVDCSACIEMRDALEAWKKVTG